MDPAVRHLAERQHGLITTAQIDLGGSSLKAVRQWVAAKELIRLAVDFLVKGTNVVLEFDGRLKYAEPAGRALWDEKRREDTLRALGYVVVRVIWTDLADPIALVDRIRDAMVRGTRSQPTPARAGTSTQPEKVALELR